jgi:hypothetical protein
MTGDPAIGLVGWVTVARPIRGQMLSSGTIAGGVALGA